MERSSPSLFRSTSPLPASPETLPPTVNVWAEPPTLKESPPPPQPVMASTTRNERTIRPIKPQTASLRERGEAKLMSVLGWVVPMQPPRPGWFAGLYLGDRKWTEEDDSHRLDRDPRAA